MVNPYESPASVGSNRWALTTSMPVEYVTRKMATFFTDEGYRLESGVPGDGRYGTGSLMMRLLWGGFAKRFRFHLQVTEDMSGTVLFIDKAMSGVSGGIMGTMNMKRELERIRRAAVDYIRTCESSM